MIKHLKTWNGCSQIEILEHDLDKEQELVAWKEQRALLAKDQCAILTQKMEELRELAREVTKGATSLAQEVHTHWTQFIDNVVSVARKEECWGFIADS